MKPIDQRAELQRYYQDRGVVGPYMQRRTAQPLNGLLHRRQVAFLNEALAQHAAHAVLEIACGPGRVTTAMRNIRFGVAIDASQPMIETALQRMDGTASSWSFLRSDAFALPFRDGSFDAAYTLRFIRHFQIEDRHRLYREIQRVLGPGGTFIVDALNYDVSYPMRLKLGLDHYQIYDVLYRPGEVEAELEAAGFRVLAVEGILRHFALQQRLNRLRFRLGGVARVLINCLERVPGTQPSTWMLLCEKQP